MKTTKSPTRAVPAGLLLAQTRAAAAKAYKGAAGGGPPGNEVGDRS